MLSRHFNLISNNPVLSTLTSENHFNVWKSEGIVFCSYPEKTDIDITLARQCIGYQIEFSRYKEHPVCIDIRGVRSMTSEARKYLAEKGVQFIKAGALIVNSPLTRMLGNIFIKINNPAAPTRLFSNEQDAIKWLKSYL